MTTRRRPSNGRSKVSVASAVMATGTGSPRGRAASRQPAPAPPELPDVPHIGTDESGKGDYFGPLVSAAVFVTPQTAPS